MSDLKRCTKCGKPKPLTDFYKRARSKDGLQDWCKDCVKAYAAAHKVEIAEKERLRYIARTPEQIARYRDKQIARYATPEGRAANEAATAKYLAKPGVMEARRVKGKEYYRLPEVWEHKKAWRQSPRGRELHDATLARRLLYPGGAPVPIATKQELRAAADGVCCYCGEHFTKGHVDHVLAVVRGGDSSWANLVYCCPSCSMEKGDKLLEAWMEQRRQAGLTIRLTNGKVAPAG